MRNIDLSSSYKEIYKESQLDEAIPAIAGAIAKTAAKAAATTAATNLADKATKPKQANNESYTAAYMEGYKELPKHKMQDKAAMKPDSAKGEKQARKMDLVRNATDGNEDLVKSVTKGQEMSNKKRGLEKRFSMPSAKNAEQKKAKNAAYKLENQRRQDLDKRYGSKKEELEAVFATLIGEGIAHNEESAINIITHMSDEWYESIVEELLSEGEVERGVDSDEAMKRHGIQKHEGPMKVTKLKPRKMRKGEGLGVGARKRQGAGKVSPANPNNYQKGEKLN